MFFETFGEIVNLIKDINCAIFIVPDPTNLPDLSLKKSTTLTLSPDKVTTITVEQVRNLAALATKKQTSDLFVIVAPAETLSEAAANAFLKNLEEPESHVHFLLFTKDPTLLLPTIRSRAQIFYQSPSKTALTDPPAVPATILTTAKQLITARPSDLPNLAANIAKQKEPRPYALTLIATAIELLYKSYFKTNDPRYLKKLPAFFNLYNAIQQNGHLKLHFVADLC